jgi:hypothetical protein
MPNIPETLNERIVGDRPSTPDLLDEPIVAYEATSMVNQVLEDFIRLWTQMDGLARAQQATAREVEREFIEKIDLLVAHASHRDSPSSALK